MTYRLFRTFYSFQLSWVNQSEILVGPKLSEILLTPSAPKPVDLSEIPTRPVRRRGRLGHAGHQFDSLRLEEDIQVCDGLVQHVRDARDLQIDVKPDDRNFFHQICFPETDQDNRRSNFQDLPVAILRWESFHHWSKTD